ncbi:TetR/AcrR family transcriptional regulator [Streptomyces sp. NPDC047072]|uniref:TetR/AcrR family transcriptional regulator n=1 Tax=Streptomyces sp. NPDC047072 TaxID=3154809 RepID=UPI0033D77DA2
MSEPRARLRRPPGASGPPRDPARDAQILRAATELLVEGGYPALTMDKAAAQAGVGKATVYRRWKSRAELAAEALDHAGLTDDLVPVTIGPGRLREELIATMTRSLGSQDTSRVDLLSALLDTARQEPELCGLVRQRYVDSLHRAVEGVLAHAAERGDLPPRRTAPSEGHSTAVSAALALLLHWHLVRGRQIAGDDIAEIVDAVLMPLLMSASPPAPPAAQPTR